MIVKQMPKAHLDMAFIPMKPLTPQEDAALTASMSFKPLPSRFGIKPTFAMRVKMAILKFFGKFRKRAL